MSVVNHMGLCVTDLHRSPRCREEALGFHPGAGPWRGDGQLLELMPGPGW